MKMFFNLFGMAAAGFLGYMVEPSLRVMLTGVRPSTVEQNLDKRILIQLPGGAAPIALSTLTPDQLPEMITINSAVNLTDAASGVTMNIQGGNQVKLFRIEGGNAVIGQSTGTFMGLIPVTETDLLQQIATNPPGSAQPRAVTPKAPKVTKKKKTPTPAVEEEEEEVVEAEAEVEEEAVEEEVVEAAPLPDADAEMEVSAVPDPEPNVAPIPAAELPPSAPVRSTDIVKAMKDSISAAQIKEFTAEQVTDWKADSDEVVEGVSYQIGIASYKAETIFGVKTIQAKALIKEGSVDRWIWPKSGMQIK